MTWLNNAYLVSTIVLPAIAIFGILQIVILRKEFKANKLRAATEKAIDICGKYSASQKGKELKLAFMQDGIDICYSGKIGNFTRQSLDIKDQSPQNQRHTKHDNLWMPLLIESDLIAAYFILRVADEKLGFRLIGKSFCQHIESHYDIISQLRADSKSEQFSSMIKLYRLWKMRLSKDQMEAEIHSIKMKMENKK